MEVYGIILGNKETVKIMRIVIHYEACNHIALVAVVICAVPAVECVTCCRRSGNTCTYGVVCSVLNILGFTDLSCCLIAIGVNRIVLNLICLNFEGRDEVDIIGGDAVCDRTGHILIEVSGLDAGNIAGKR